MKKEETPTMLHKALSYFGGFKIKTMETPLNGYLEIWYKNGRYLLDSEHTNYSFGMLHKIFQLTFSELNLKGKAGEKIKDVLLLGMGGGSVIHILKKELKLPVKIVAVDHDPEILDLAREYFDIDKYDDTEIILRDAYDFVMETTSTFDLIIVDIFTNYEIPVKFTETVFLNRAEEILNPRGILILNYIIKTRSQREKQMKVLWYLNSQYSFTKDLTFFGSNRVIICRKG
ncbi:MAG: methyltransferase domain-containing protein [Bacteroidetes bacterium]|nr:methyltransferase domain-containing protein [Bacteroidota bacterium]